MPVDLAVARVDPADHHLHGLAGQRAEPLRQLEDLMGFDLLLVSHVDKPNEDGKEQLVGSGGGGGGQDLHPAINSYKPV